MPMHAAVVIASWFAFLAFLFFAGLYLAERSLDRRERKRRLNGAAR